VGLHSSSCLLLFRIAAALVRPALPLQASSPLCSVVVIALLRLGVMGKAVVPMRGICADFKARLACYKHDWIGGFDSGYRCVRERERERQTLCPFFFFSFCSCKQKKSNIAVANLGFLGHCASSSAAVFLLLQSRENTMLNPTRSGK
jgi:hypothetical protein